jgi:FAD/FMN-containing dehydrogenase
MSAAGETKAVAMVDPAQVRKFCDALDGETILPTDPEYNAARRIWNGMIDRRPGLIVKAAGLDDVIRTIEFARDNGLLLAVRAGGHSLAGKCLCDDGVVLDLSLLKTIEVDPYRRVARAGAGMLLGEFDQATQAFGLATTLGTAPDTGMAGLTLGGGLGWLMNKQGLACDNLIAAEVATADGNVLRASASENPELFWALRGGGGNFGVVTNFTFRLHRRGPVLGGLIAYPLESARQVMRAYREWAHGSPDEMGSMVGCLPTPSGLAFGVIVCYAGDDLAQGEPLVRPLRKFAPVLGDTVRPIPYLEMQKLLEIAPGRLSYWRSGFLSEISDAAVECIAANLENRPFDGGGFFAQPLFGAPCRVGRDATAFSHRDRGYDFAAMGVWDDRAKSDAAIGWVRGFWDGIAPLTTGGVYVNTLGEGEGEDRVRAAYGTSYERLVEIKNRYDPANFFRANPNVRPTAA